MGERQSVDFLIQEMLPSFHLHYIRWRSDPGILEGRHRKVQQGGRTFDLLQSLLDSLCNFYHRKVVERKDLLMLLTSEDGGVLLVIIGIVNGFPLYLKMRKTLYCETKITNVRWDWLFLSISRREIGGFLVVPPIYHLSSRNNCYSQTSGLSLSEVLLRFYDRSFVLVHSARNTECRRHNELSQYVWVVEIPCSICINNFLSSCTRYPCVYTLYVGYKWKPPQNRNFTPP